MSRQLIVDYIPFEISREQINESISNNGGRLIVKGDVKPKRKSLDLIFFINITN